MSPSYKDQYEYYTPKQMHDVKLSWFFLGGFIGTLMGATGVYLYIIWPITYVKHLL